MLISYKAHQNIEGFKLLQRFIMVLYQCKCFKASVINTYTRFRNRSVSVYMVPSRVHINTIRLGIGRNKMCLLFPLVNIHSNCIR